MNYKFIIVFIGVIALGGIWFFGKENPEAKQDTAKEHIQRQTGPIATINGHVLQLEVVRTPEEQSKGLSGRESLAENRGMLFVYERSAVPGFWMPDMNFPIDIIWIDKDFKIVGIENNVAPETFPELFRPSSPIMYVLEVNAGWAKDHNIAIGDEILLDGIF